MILEVSKRYLLVHCYRNNGRGELEVSSDSPMIVEVSKRYPLVPL